MNRIIPRMTLLIPPCWSCGRAATGLWSVVRAWLSFVIVAPSVPGGSGRQLAGPIGSRRDRVVPRLAMANIEHRPLGADLRESVEVVRRGRRARRPLQRVALPRVVAGGLAAAQRDEDVPQQRQHARRDEEATDRRGEVQVVPAG